MTLAKNEYGTTWWGERWLNALTGIDYENRIPRGFAYANEGKVNSPNLDPDQNMIKARVEGQYDPFYSVKIRLPKFTEEEKTRLLDAIAENPVILARLSARELAPEIDTLAQEQGINIFPEKWSDLKASCSCPDTAVPCKHIAAVIYKFSQVIDANPFVIFELKGLDLVAELAKRDVNIGQVEESEMPTWAEIISSRNSGLQPISMDEFRKATFKEVPELTDSIVGLFKPSPAGYIQANLRDVMKECMQRAAKLADAQLKDNEDRDLPSYDTQKPILTFDSWGRIRLNESFSWKTYSMENSGREASVYPFAVWKEKYDGAAYYEMFSGAINQKALEIAPVEIEALYNAWVLAAKLVKSGALIPQIYEPVDDFFAVRWIPAVMSKEVRDIVTAVGRFFMTIDNTVISVARRPENMNPYVLGEMILSMYLGSYITKAFIELHDDYASEDLPLECQSIFLGKLVDLEEGFHARESVKKRLESWIAPIYLQNLKVQPVIILEDQSAAALAEVINEARTVYETESDGDADIDLESSPVYQADRGEVVTAPEADEEDLTEAKKGHRKGLFDNTAGIQISMGFNRLDQQGTPEDTFIPLSEIIENREYQKIRFECLRTVARLSSVCPPLTELLENRGGVGIIALDDLAPIIQSTIPAMKILGVRLIVPKALKSVIYPKSSMTVSMRDRWDDGTGFTGITDLLDFDWSIALGDRSISPEEFADLRLHEGKVVRFGESFVYVDPALTSRIAKKLAGGSQAPGKQRLMAAALTGRFGEDNVAITKELRDCLQNILSEKSIEVPPTFKAQLRPYQLRGYSWLTKNLRTMMGSILADDMGLGKTVQVIAAIEKLRYDGELRDKQVLVTVPVSLLVSWDKELAKFAPELRVNTFYTERDLSKPADVVLTSYGVLRSENKLFQKLKLRLIVIDEAQNIKNTRSQIFKVVRSIKADSMIAMSGTPVENRLLEYWSIMDFANPGLLGSAEAFKREFANPIERTRDPAAVKSFKLITAPFIMRRLKSDKSIISDLPDKIVIDKYCTLTPEQVALYQEKVNHSMLVMEELDSLQRSSVVLNLIRSLKMICNAPAHYSQEDSHQDARYSGKMEVLFDLLDDMFENNKKCLIFTQFKVMGDLLQKWIEERTGFRPEFIHGGLSASERAAMVDKFQNRRDERCMILSLKAAGTGLTLTAASAVIHYDLWWNPAVEDQATDRAYRIGQKENVQVYRLICANTFEEKINDIIKSKKDLADIAINVGEKWIGDLSNRQIEEIFAFSTEEAEKEKAQKDRRF